jgi:hypothetical protein
MEAVVIERKIDQLPFEARKEVSDYLDFIIYKYRNRKPVKPYAGCMKGMFIWMSEDFNEPLDDFKDYM